MSILSDGLWFHYKPRIIREFRQKRETNLVDYWRLVLSHPIASLRISNDRSLIIRDDFYANLAHGMRSEILVVYFEDIRNSAIGIPRNQPLRFFEGDLLILGQLASSI